MKHLSVYIKLTALIMCALLMLVSCDLSEFDLLLQDEMEEDSVSTDTGSDTEAASDTEKPQTPPANNPTLGNPEDKPQDTGKEDGDKENGGNSNTGNTSKPGSAVAATGLEIKDLCGMELKMLYSVGASNSPELTSDSTATVVEQATYARNTLMEKTFNVKITYDTVAVSNTMAQEEAEKIRKYVSAGEPMDMFFANQKNAARLALEGLFVDLMTYGRDINTDAYYYESRFNEGMEICDQLYFASGFYSLNNIKSLDATFVDCEALGANTDDFYKLVNENKWTFDKMLELGLAFSNGSTDIYPVFARNNAIGNLFYNMGGKTVETEDGYMYTMFELTEFLVDLTDDIFNNIGMAESSDDMATAFAQKKAPFILATLRDYRPDGGWIVLPAPTDEGADGYTSYSDAFYVNVAAISFCRSFSDDVVYLYEMFMAASYDCMYEVFFEDVFGMKYSKNFPETQMYDIIANSRTSCILEAYGVFPQGSLSGFMLEYNGSIATSFAAHKARMVKMLDAVLEQYVRLQ